MGEIASLENKDKLQALTKEEGFNIDLIVPSKENYIPPHEYIIYAKANYENGKTSYEELEKALGYIGLNMKNLDTNKNKSNISWDFKYKYKGEKKNEIFLI